MGKPSHAICKHFDTNHSEISREHRESSFDGLHLDIIERIEYCPICGDKLEPDSKQEHCVTISIYNPVAHEFHKLKRKRRNKA